VRKEILRQKKPYFIAAVLGMILVVFAYGGFFHRVASVKNAEVDKIKTKVGPLTAQLSTLGAEIQKRDAAMGVATNYLSYVDERLLWGKLLGSLRQTMIAIETEYTIGDSTRAEENDHAGLWIDSMKPLIAAPTATPSGASRTRNATVAPVGPATLYYIDIRCSAKNLLHRAPAANNEFAYAFGKALGENPLFNPLKTELQKIETATEDQEIFSFDVRLLLRNKIVIH